MNSLASTFRGQAKVEEAETMFTAVLEKMKMILGDERPDTLLTVNNLASTLRDKGKVKEAGAILTEVLEKRNVFRGDYADNISAIDNVSNTPREQGKTTLKEAIAITAYNHLLPLSRHRSI